MFKSLFRKGVLVVSHVALMQMLGFVESTKLCTGISTESYGSSIRLLLHLETTSTNGDHVAQGSSAGDNAAYGVAGQSQFAGE